MDLNLFLKLKVQRFFKYLICLFLDLVARMIKFWNAPLLTTGGFTNDFSLDKRDPKSKYFLLVRTGTLDFQDIGDVVVSVLNR